MDRAYDSLRRFDHIRALPPLGAGFESEHWMLGFLEELLAQFRTSGDVSFDAVQRLLRQHEQSFLRDLETARRMYRTYPRLFQEAGSSRTDESKAAQA